MENNNIKINFFQKIKISIFNLEKYGLFISERLGKSIKYAFLLILIFTVCYTSIYIYDASKMINKGTNFVENELPEFTLKDGIIKFETPINGYDEEFDFKVESLDKDDIELEELNKYYDYTNTLLFLNQKIVFITNGQNIDYSYDYIQETFGTNINNKVQLLESFQNLGGKTQITVAIGITLFISFLTANIYQILIDCIIVAIYGYLVARINRIKIKFGTASTLAIYSLTLSMILNAIYVIVYYFTKFEIQYFSWLYIIIAYIYITAAILMIKTDLIKQVMELRKIENIEQKEENSLEKQPLEKDNKKENKDEKEDNIDEENQPDGSEI